MNVSDELICRSFLADRSDPQRDGAPDFVRFDEHADSYRNTYGFNSRMLFGRIVYTEDGRQSTTESLAIKQTPAANLDPLQCQLQFANEIHFFTRVLPFLESTVAAKADAFFPRFLYSVCRQAPAAEHAAIVFENLRDGGFVAHRSSAGILLDYGHLSLALRQLGRFHGHSLAAAHANPHRFQQLANFLPRSHERYLLHLRTLCQALLDYSVELLATREPSYASRLQPLRRISRHLVERLRTVNDSPSLTVFCHGDLLATNLLFRYDEGVPVEVRVLDMGLCRLASPALDLAHAMYACADQRTRDRHWDDLMADYRRGMAEIVAAERVPSIETIADEFRKHCWYVIMIATHSLRDLQASAQKSTRFFDVFGVNVSPASMSTEEIRRTYEENEFGGAAATDIVLAILKDMIDRNFVS